MELHAYRLGFSNKICNFLAAGRFFFTLVFTVFISFLHPKECWNARYTVAVQLIIDWKRDTLKLAYQCRYLICKYVSFLFNFHWLLRWMQFLLVSLGHSLWPFLGKHSKVGTLKETTTDIGNNNNKNRVIVCFLIIKEFILTVENWENTNEHK